MSRRFRQVDVFAPEPCTGNPVAVVLDAEGLDDDEMRRISSWTNLSECTFVLAPQDPDADYRVRIFNLDIELPFAGHPTLGTARAWLDAGGSPASPDLVVQECGVGLVPVRVDGELLSFAAPPLVRSGPVDAEDLVEVLDVLGADPTTVVAAQWLDNGPGWVVVLFDAADTVLALRPDLGGRPGRWDIGVVGPAPGGDEAALELRAFFTDGNGPLREDPVTGSLNAGVGQWLLGTGVVNSPYVARQGTALGRRGRIEVEGDGTDVWVGGRTHVVVTGQIDLD